MPQSPRHSFGEGALGKNTSRQDRIRGSEARTDDEGRRKLGPQHRVHEARGHEPAEAHDGPQHHAHALPVAGEVGLGQLHADGEALQADDDPRRLLRDVVGEPSQRADEVGALGPEGYADEEGQGGLGEVEAVPDEG